MIFLLYRLAGRALVARFSGSSTEADATALKQPLMQSESQVIMMVLVGVAAEAALFLSRLFLPLLRSPSSSPPILVDVSVPI